MKDLSEALEEELQAQGLDKERVEELVLDGKCRATDLTCLNGMSELKSLFLCNVGLTTLEGFPALPKLTELYLSDNKIVGGLHFLVETVPELKKLSLASNRIADISQLEPLTQLNLTLLDLYECPVTLTSINYRSSVLAMFPSLEILDRLDRDGIELLDDEELEEEESDMDNEDDDDDFVDDGEEVLNLITDSLKEDEGNADDEDSEPEEINLEILAGPPIPEELSDADYVAPEEGSSQDGTSCEQIPTSQLYGAGSSSSNPAPDAAPGGSSSGSKRKRQVHGTEDLTREPEQDEDYADV